ncbi:MAG: hypothetical protein M0041_01445 [Nitrospiraceae bacterium]|nr:hypothetical protein [Nitrospiraceae bacterium]
MKSYLTSVEGILQRDESGYFLRPGILPEDPSVTRFVLKEDWESFLESLIGKRVRISGLATFHREETFPFSLEVSRSHFSDVFIFPPESERRSLYEFLGMCPDATGDLPSEEWVKNLRMECEDD